MSKRGRVRRSLAAGAVGVSMAAGLAACSSGGGGSRTGKGTSGSGSVGAALRAYLAAKATHPVVMTETLEQSAHGDLEVYTGTGVLDSASGDWSIIARPLRVPVTDNQFNEAVIDAGGTAYMDPASLPVLMPKASWVTMSGPLAALDNGAVLPLSITPEMAAEAAAAAGTTYRSIGTSEVLGVKEQGYEASVPAGTALASMASAGTPAPYVALARALFDGRTVTVSVFLTGSGTLGAVGYGCVAASSVEAVGAIYYPTQAFSTPPSPAPETGVVSLTALQAALRAYDIRTHQKLPPS